MSGSLFHFSLSSVSFSSTLFTDTDETAFSISDVTQKSISPEFTKDDNFSRLLDDPSPVSSCSGLDMSRKRGVECLVETISWFPGRIAWDFRRQTDNESDWGSKLRFLPESRNMSMLSIESSSWKNDYAIPYPTCFHPRSVDEIAEWQELMRSRKRQYLFAFAGAPRPEYKDSVRGKIIDECLESKKQCYLLDCNYGNVNCDNPVNVMKVFRNLVFCLQPPGDSYTSRSIFDSILAGWIPVFFHPGTAYAQYKWHLPKNHTSYSVYLPVKDVKEWNIKIKERLIEIPEERVVRLREEVIKLIPRVVYADLEYGSDGNEDAFELALKGMLERIEDVREMMRQGKDGSDGFDDRDDYKYTFSPYEPQILA